MQTPSHVGLVGASLLVLALSAGDAQAKKFVGTPGNDDIGGTSAADEIWGYGGSDHLWGSNGNDRIVGGAGNDRVYGNHGNDLLYGSEGDDDMQGHQGNDLVDGKDGADTLAADVGNDVMIGGSGNDQFAWYFEEPYDPGRPFALGSDVVVDFIKGRDKLFLSIGNVQDGSEMLTWEQLDTNGNGVWAVGDRGMSLRTVNCNGARRQALHFNWETWSPNYPPELAAQGSNDFALCGITRLDRTDIVIPMS